VRSRNTKALRISNRTNIVEDFSAGTATLIAAFVIRQVLLVENLPGI